MNLIGLLLNHWEFYWLLLPYSILALWLFSRIHQRTYRYLWNLLAAGAGFWLLFVAGLVVIGSVGLVLIMFRHAEKV